MPKKSSKSKLSTGKDRSVDSAVDKQRLEARKRLLAAKRAASVRQNSATESADSIEIYVPEAQTRLWEQTSTDHRRTVPNHFRCAFDTGTQIWTHHVQRMHRGQSLIAAQLTTGEVWRSQGTETSHNNADLHPPVMGLNILERYLILLLLLLLIIIIEIISYSMLIRTVLNVQISWLWSSCMWAEKLWHRRSLLSSNSLPCWVYWQFVATWFFWTELPSTHTQDIHAGVLAVHRVFLFSICIGLPLGCGVYVLPYKNYKMALMYSEV